MTEYEKYLQKLANLPASEKKKEKEKLHMAEDTAFTEACYLYRKEHKEIANLSFEEYMKVSLEVYREVDKALNS